MRFQTLAGPALIGCLLVFGFGSSADSLALRRSPLLGATLPAGATYEVQTNTGGGWGPAGVLIAGTGSANVVRLDGFPDTAAFRLAHVGSGTLLTPTLSSGWHLAVAAPGANEIRFESAPALTGGNNWTPYAFAFPEAGGEFISPVKAPLASQAFFRSLTPARPLSAAILTYFTPDLANTASGFGLVLEDMPQLYRDGYIAALCSAAYHRDGHNAAAAGECYELTGPDGTVTVMVAELNPTPPAGTCDAGRLYFDLGAPAFAALFPPAIGIGSATWRLVPAPVTGNVKLVVKEYAGGYYLELRPYNHRAGLSRLEIRGPAAGGTGGNWTELPRSTYNAFVYSGTPPGFPLEVRVTSRFGESVVFPSISAITQYQRFVASSQFASFPALEPAPVWLLPPVYTDALANVLGAQWTAVAFGGATVDPAYTAAAYTGAASLRVSNLAAWSGVTFAYTQQFPSTPDAFLEFAARSDAGAAVTNLVVAFAGVNNAGGAATSTSVALPAIGSSWRRLRIPLQPAQAPARIGLFRVFNNSASAQPGVLLDAVSFVQR